jgi:putative toxin-antitoxin system antitoxin component (TIGR02293 family)
MAKAITLNDPALHYGVTDDRNILRFIETLKKGIAYSLFERFAKTTPFSHDEWSAFLHMSERTLQRHKQQKKAFGPVYSEKILQITLLYNLGLEVFGSKEKFHTWLETKNVGLGGVKPMELLDNSFGIGLLKDALIRIEQGVLA